MGEVGLSSLQKALSPDHTSSKAPSPGQVPHLKLSTRDPHPPRPWVPIGPGSVLCLTLGHRGSRSHQLRDT